MDLSTAFVCEAAFQAGRRVLMQPFSGQSQPLHVANESCTFAVLPGSSPGTYILWSFALRAPDEPTLATAGVPGAPMEIPVTVQSVSLDRLSRSPEVVWGNGQDGSGNVDTFMGVAERVAPDGDRELQARECDAVVGSYGPGDLDDYCHVLHYWSLHRAGGHFLLCDGSVRMITYDVDQNLMRSLAARSGHEVIDAF